MFDAYQKWLGIPPKDQPPNYYRLLSLELFESDLDVIEGGVDRAMGYIRKYQSGEYAPEAARLLNEISVARLCLLKAEKKAAYDAKLRMELTAHTESPVNDPFADIDLPVPPRRTRSTPKPRERKSVEMPGRAGLLPVVIAAVAICVVAGFWSLRTRNEVAKPPANDASPDQVASKPTEISPSKDASPGAMPASPTATSPSTTASPSTGPTAPSAPAIGLMRTWNGKIGHSQLRTFSEDGKRLVYILNKEVYVADCLTGEAIATLAGNTSSIWTARFCEGDTHVVSVGRDETLRIWNLNNGEMESVLSVQTHDYGTVIAASRSALKIAFASHSDKQLSVIDRQTGKILQNIAVTNEGATFRAVSQDLRFALSNGAGSESQLWDLASGTPATIGSKQINTGGDFSFDGTQVIIGGGQGWEIWDLESQSLVQKSREGVEFVWCVATNRTMTRLITGHSDGTIWLWDLVSGKKMMSFLGHEYQLRTIKMSPDDRYAVSMDDKHNLCLWRLPD